jgi:branched-subunit amino acid transport protein
MNHYLLIIGMFAVTYLPRLLPFYALRRRPQGRLKRFFDALPVAAMAALVFPDALGALAGASVSSPTGHGGVLTAAVGLATAALVGWFTRGLLIPLLAAVGVVAVMLVVGV